MSEVVASDILRSVVERIERLEEDKKNLGMDIKEVYSEAEGNGFDKKAIRKIVRMRAKDAQELKEEQEILDLYTSALGM